ncbi:hypothetical protein APHAL10511_002307 [Amanita phalloides]|nr:hypothetical protein APHAL10511_002307 [Amanita phalloides]
MVELPSPSTQNDLPSSPEPFSLRFDFPPAIPNRRWLVDPPMCLRMRACPVSSLDDVKDTLEHAQDARTPLIDLDESARELTAVTFGFDIGGSTHRQAGRRKRNEFHFKEFILGTISLALGTPTIFMRTKALRTLARQTVTSDATILLTAIPRSIQTDCACLSLMFTVPRSSRRLLCKYCRPHCTSSKCSSHSIGRIDIATHLVLHMLDKDDSVKDLAMMSIKDLWFPSGNASSVHNLAKSRTLAASEVSQDESQVQGKVVVIIGTAANFKDRRFPWRPCYGREGGAMIYTNICETSSGFMMVNCITTIYLLSALSSGLVQFKYSTLLPSLGNANTIPVLPINQLLANIPIKDKNTKDLKSLILPPASKYHLVSGTNDISIGLDKYTQIRAAATITTPVGTFRTKADRVVCSVEYVDIKTLEQYKIRCSHSYDVKLITLRERGQVPELEHDDYVEECTLFAWSNVIFNKGPLSRFTSPALKPRVT